MEKANFGLISSGRSRERPSNFASIPLFIVHEEQTRNVSRYDSTGKIVTGVWPYLQSDNITAFNDVGNSSLEVAMAAIEKT
eukprot:878078-Pyramimonas_sp.AAC.1